MCVCAFNKKWFKIHLDLDFICFDIPLSVFLLFGQPVLFGQYCSVCSISPYVLPWQLQEKRVLIACWNIHGVLSFFFVASMCRHTYTQESTHFIYHDIYLFDVQPKYVCVCGKKGHQIVNGKKSSTGLINKMRTFITCVRQIYFYFCLFIEMLSHYHLIENRVGILMV